MADEDPAAVETIVSTLRDEGFAVFHAYDVLGATQLAVGLTRCDLVLSNTTVSGMDGVEVIAHLRRARPAVPVIYLANTGRSTPEIESRLPADVPILREPFTREKLTAPVNTMLGDGRHDSA